MAESPRRVLHFHIALDWCPDGINQVACLERKSRGGDVRIGDICADACFCRHGEVGRLSGEERWGVGAISTPYLYEGGCVPHFD